MTRKKHNPLVKRIRREAAYYLIRSVVGAFRLLPRRVAIAVGSVVGRLAPYVVRSEYRRAVEHLTIAFGQEKSAEEIQRLARDMFRYLGMNFVDTARLRTMSADDITGVCVPHNVERLHEEIAKGHGVIGLTSHTGCWELLGVYLATVGVPTSAIARRLYDNRIEELLTDTRRAGGMVNIARGHDTRDIIRALRNNYLVGILIDQDIKVKGEFVDFFGKPAYTATGAALLSLKYDAPVMPIMTYRDDHHRHHICIGEPITIEPSGDIDRDILELTARCSKATEDFIRAHPEQWVWFHKRWKSKPSATAPVEPKATDSPA